MRYEIEKDKCTFYNETSYKEEIYDKITIQFPTNPPKQKDIDLAIDKLGKQFYSWNQPHKFEACLDYYDKPTTQCKVCNWREEHPAHEK